MLVTGFIISRKIDSNVADFDTISDRICKLRLRGKFRKLSLLNVHAPSEDKRRNIKKEFYDGIELIHI